MRAKLTFALAALAVPILAGACGSSDGNLVPLRLLQAGRRLELKVEVAATYDTRVRGLMGRSRLPAGRGMLFLFPGQPQTRNFWMKNTFVPLELAFIREGRITEIQRMVPCRTNLCPYTTSAAPADSALELLPGSLARAGLGVGASVAVMGDLPTPS
jgi:uncharacterized protein